MRLKRFNIRAIVRRVSGLMLIIALIGLACYYSREFLLLDVKVPLLRVGSHFPCDPRDMLYREDLDFYNRWRWASGREMNNLKSTARSLLGLDREMKRREEKRRLREIELRMECLLKGLEVDITKWSEPTPGQVTKIKGELGKWKVVEPVRVYISRSQPRERHPHAPSWEMIGAGGNLTVAWPNDGSGEVYLAHVREENEAEKQARHQSR
jgi:hypothetical protein